MTTSSPSHYPVIIIGGGQAGLSVSWYLCAEGVEHLVLERHARFESWRNNRWDSFCLVTPNWQCRLPGWPYRGSAPDGFMGKDEIVEYLDGFAASFDPPLREGVNVTGVRQQDDGYVIDTTIGRLTADQVVIATGGYDTPITPPYAAELDPAVVQMHSRDYRRPEQLPDGATLIVGTGQSGVQLMDDFHLEGREVHLAVGPAPRSPRKYRGRDATDWLYDAGHYDITIDRHPDPHKALTQTNHYMSGRDGGKEIDLRRYALEGVRLYGSVSGGGGTRLEFLPDLEKNLDDADRSYIGIRTQIDAWIDRQGIDAPHEAPFEKLWRPETEITAIDLHEQGITSIIWAIGFRPDYTWLPAGCLDTRGRPSFDRGVTKVPGLYFIGLGWLNTWGSGRFLGIDEDSRHLAAQILTRHRAGLAA
ncbi:MSMEG_0569 family flavin-dependent oxidoreductase [Paracoccus aestuariivivens]|uniref:MSMEG_0569 family flavin-dependent oxidoreductase n=1 Tax=Paracoccus aestuariivivens TaxID=1820333 RepID=A0A6L6J8K2_9RHOB|nr:MSMEG_0569 family flavin-dependent oxidoreductase [Paracoccus aestuariivivens]MTH78483.1 MSMEG_0569 family flavin-dependent oxidoreductase [Paracoccus aestuariivivens]